MQIINQNSLVLLALIILTGVAIFLFRDGIKSKDWLILGGLTAGMLLAWWFFRPTAHPIEVASQVRNQIGADLPVLLEFQSPY